GGVDWAWAGSELSDGWGWLRWGTRSACDAGGVAQGHQRRHGRRDGRRRRRLVGPVTPRAGAAATRRPQAGPGGAGGGRRRRRPLGGGVPAPVRRQWGADRARRGQPR